MRCGPYRWTAPWTLSTITAQFRTLAAVKWNLVSVRPRHLRLLPLFLSQPKLQALFSKYPMSFWCWCSSWEKFSSTEWSARPGSLPKEAAGQGGGGNNVFLYSLGAVQVGLGKFFATLGYIFSSTFANLFMLDFIFLCSYRYQSNSWELVTLWNHYN